MVSIAMMRCCHSQIKRASTLRQSCAVLRQQGFVHISSPRSLFHHKNPNLFLNLNRKISEEPCNSKDEVAAVNPYAPKKGFAQIYKFPYIVQAQTVCRLKIWQTAFTAIVIPALYIFYPTSASPVQLLAVGGLGTFACLMLGVMGEIFRKFVGIIYYNPDTKQVCVAHLTFWGDRHNSYYDAEDVVPFGDYERNLDDIFIKLKFYSKPSTSYWINLRYGVVVHKDHFYEVFRCLPFEEEN